ncbi:SDR family NAD(P)-dependent oxidoreductase [Cellulomonas sp. NPDC089187]|uniref:SDR family NAD(P)-dependent oxidoreductase n=1 Tax=Cellulomonas sp. NPDC089187 TaxID=3154970 RepID=UPI00342C6AA5
MTRTIVVTGSASGIGATTAELLRDRGDRVIGIDLREADINADLSVPEARERAVRETTDRADGVIDAVIACAGISAPVPATIAVNYFGVTELLTGLLPALSRSAAPRAAVVSSMASLQPNSPELVAAALAGDEQRALAIAHELCAHGPEAGYIVYPSSKRALSRWVRRESITPAWAGAGIPLNAVAPGTVLTPMTQDLLSDPTTVAMVDAAVPMPLGYHQPPGSIAHLLIWLTGPENTHLAGQVIYDDGGADVSLRGEDIWSWADRS